MGLMEIFKRGAERLWIGGNLQGYGAFGLELEGGNPSPEEYDARQKTLEVATQKLKNGKNYDGALLASGYRGYIMP